MCRHVRTRYKVKEHALVTKKTPLHLHTLSIPLQPDVGLLPQVLCAGLYVATPVCAKSRIVCGVD